MSLYLLIIATLIVGEGCSWSEEWLQINGRISAELIHYVAVVKSQDLRIAQNFSFKLLSVTNHKGRCKSKPPPESQGRCILIRIHFYNLSNSCSVIIVNQECA